MRVRIGITSGWEPGTVVEGWPLVYANMDMAERIVNAGGLPVIFPVVKQQELYTQLVSEVDAVIVSGEVLSIKRNVVKGGGKNVLHDSNPLRYQNEKWAINAALEKEIPLLGICRGFQVLAVEQGGTMKEGDVNEGNNVIHQQGGIKPPDSGIHNISVKAGTKLHTLLDTSSIMVNSFHRQAVGTIPEGYIVSAVAEDGNIEAIERITEPLVMGLQFHPEMLKEPVWDEFFKKFIEIVQNYKDNR